ncbi:MAG: type II secretion system F family protein [Haloferacaceae archaeon]
MLPSALPLALAVVLLAPLALARVNRRTDLLLTRVAVVLFGRYVANRSDRRPGQVDALRAARARTTHRVYAARTLLLAALWGVAGSALGVYLAAGLLALFRVSAGTLRGLLPGPLDFLANVARVPALTTPEVLGLLLASTATVGAGAAALTHWLRWAVLRARARSRSTSIDATLPRTVAFVYALSRSGMAFPAVLDTLTRNEAVYGEAARELGIAVREMNAFGTDVVTALQRTADTTPSDNLDEFGDNLASVLASGRSLPEFLRDQYERYQTEARAQQEQYLDLLATFAEVYVTALVAGPLFLVTILVVIGLVLRDTLPVVRFIGYVGLPLATAGFVVYIDSMTETLPDRRAAGGVDGRDEVTDPRRSTRRSTAGAATDGGTATEASGAALGARERENLARVAVHDRIARLRRWVDDPFGTVLSDPATTLVATVPLAVVWVLARTGPVPTGYEAVRVVDAPLVEATVFVLVGYAAVYEHRKREAAALERSVPDFLDRMASVNEAGMTVVESLDRVNRGDLGALGEEVDRTWRDVRWGADARTALHRLERRTRSVAVSQAVTLVTNAMHASGDLAPVLRIAADEAAESQRLRRERRQEMLTYLLVIYLSFLVFLAIVVALTVSFIPAIEEASAAGAGPAGATGRIFGGISDVNTAAYRLLFFHLAVVQGACSGVVAGQLGEGSVRDGVKHAAVLLGVAYVVFLFV